MPKIGKNSDFVSNETEINCQLLKKSSFDRFGDDLCELLLSYLPISDKIRLECLSKQVQSLIFNKQKCLRISHVKSDDNLEEMITKTSRYHSVDCRAFGSVLKKFKNLDNIRVEGRMTVDSSLVHTIAYHCKQLKILWITVRFVVDITNDCLKNLGQKCGPTLQSLKFDGLSEKQMRLLLCLTPELRSITVDNIKSVISDGKQSKKLDKNSDVIPKFLPKLQEIQFCRCTEKTLNQFQNEYSDNILKITTHLLSFDLRSEAMTRALTGFGRFQKLQSLDLFIDVVDNSDIQSIDNGLKQLAKECRQLKQLSFTLDGNLLQNNNLFSIFASFKSLTSLEINIIADQDLDDNPLITYNYGSIRDLRHLSKLKHLSLTLEQLSDTCIENIDKYLPQLLSIRFNTTKAITDNSLKYISQMKYLTKLDIICFTAEDDHNITDDGVLGLIAGCPQIRTMSFDQKNSGFDFDITEASIESIIQRSKRMEKIQYNISFGINKYEKTIQLTNKMSDLPQNLSIEIM